MNQNLQMIRGNDFSFNIAVTTAGTPYNITGADLRFTAKWSPTDADAAAIIVLTIGSGITVTSATSGLATLTIPRADTNISAIPYHRVDLSYDLQLYTSANLTNTILYGTLTIWPDISQTAP